MRYKKQEFKQSLERNKSQWGLKFLLSPYVPGSMYTTYLHEMTVKEAKSLNAKLIKEIPKDEKEDKGDESIGHSLNGA